MLFNSIQFIFFLTATLTTFSLSPKQFRKYILLIASLYFYATWNFIYLLLILFITVTSYAIGRIISGRTPKNSFSVCASIIFSLGVLGIFKYGDFAIENINYVLNIVSEDLKIKNLNFILPLGISFYTFQAISYVIDVYKGKIDCENNMIDYSLYITFFPKLCAGPIERAGNFLPQIKNNLEVLPQNIIPGFTLILTGFFKKLVIADRLSIFVDKVYAAPGSFTAEYVILAFYFFAFQIYCDFSGYTDIARGVARLFNVELMINFDRPYFATSVQDFWRRWHISLSTWFRDYLYIPLGGSKKGYIRTLANIMIVFALCGLWHGAAYTFIIWGTLHGLSLIGQHIFTRSHISVSQRLYVPKALKIFATFHVICLFWIFFRANNLIDAWRFMINLFNAPDPYTLGELIFTTHENFLSVFSILFLILFEAIPFGKIRNNGYVGRSFEMAYQIICFYMILAFGIFDFTTFIYIQF